MIDLWSGPKAAYNLPEFAPILHPFFTHFAPDSQDRLDKPVLYYSLAICSNNELNHQ